MEIQHPKLTSVDWTNAESKSNETFTEWLLQTIPTVAPLHPRAAGVSFPAMSSWSQSDAFTPAAAAPARGGATARNLDGTVGDIPCYKIPIKIAARGGVGEALEAPWTDVSKTPQKSCKKKVVSLKIDILYTHYFGLRTSLACRA